MLDPAAAKKAKLSSPPKRVRAGPAYWPLPCWPGWRRRLAPPAAGRRPLTPPAAPLPPPPPQPAGAAPPPKQAAKPDGAKPDTPKPEAPWPEEKLRAMQESGEVVEARIERVNKGGVKLRVEGASGFIPFRRLAAKRIKAGVEDMSYLVGQTVRAKIVEVRGRGGRWGAGWLAGWLAG